MNITKSTIFSSKNFLIKLKVKLSDKLFQLNLNILMKNNFKSNSINMYMSVL